MKHNKLKILFSLLAGVTAAVSVAGFAACGGGGDEGGGGDGGNGGKPSETQITHDKNTYEVTGKPGTYEPHDFVDGKCTMCDETTIFSQASMAKDAIVSTPCDQQGTITKITYATDAYPDYAYATDGVVTKSAYVYTPYGYDPADKETKYNVLYLLHGNGLNEDYWFAQEDKNEAGSQFYPGSNAYPSGYGTENVLDHLFEDGKAAKTIIVTPTFYSPAEDVYGEEFAVDRSNMVITQTFWQELKNDLMPYVATHFNTYAQITEDMTAEEMQAEFIENRDHQGYAGLSMGGMTSFASVWKHCIDYISYIGCFSGASSADADMIIEQKNDGIFKDYAINYWFVGVGTAETPETHFEVYLKYRNEV